MLHHNEGVSQVTQVLQGAQQLVVIPLVQADGRLVQDIQHAHQGRSDLGSQADPLALAAGKGACRPGQGQIAQAHIHEELQPGLDLLDDLLCHQSHIAGELQVFHEFQPTSDAHPAKIHNADAAHGDGSCDLGKPVAAAGGTGSGGHTFLQLLPGRIGLGFFIPAGNVI